jgi:hypothetical protein
MIEKFADARPLTPCSETLHRASPRTLRHARVVSKTRLRHESKTRLPHESKTRLRHASRPHLRHASKTASASVMPAQAGIHARSRWLSQACVDRRLRGDDVVIVIVIPTTSRRSARRALPWSEIDNFRWWSRPRMHRRALRKRQARIASILAMHMISPGADRAAICASLARPEPLGCASRKSIRSVRGGTDPAVEGNWPLDERVGFRPSRRHLAWRFFCCPAQPAPSPSARANAHVLGEATP